MRKLLASAGALAIAAATLGTVTSAYAADHLDAPAVKTDGRTDINDVYAFRSPTNPANTVLVMTVNPLAGTQNGTTFHDHAKYQFVVDTNGDAKSDGYVNFKFDAADSNGQQEYEVALDLARDREYEGTTGQVASLEGAGSAWAGIADDPFFFDLAAFNDQVLGQGGGRSFCDGRETNFFAGLNVNAVAIELPSQWLGGSQIGVWGRTRVDGGTIDQMGRPAINTALIDPADKNTFNVTKPDRQRASFGPGVAAKVQGLSGLDGTGYDAPTASLIAAALLPDILTVDTSSGAGFEVLNGRKLTDDVLDTELDFLTGGLGVGAVLTSDCVANDSAFPSTFPYLAPAN